MRWFLCRHSGGWLEMARRTIVVSAVAVQGWQDVNGYGDEEDRLGSGAPVGVVMEKKRRIGLKLDLKSGRFDQLG
ncbi:hypothetical protein HAX54_026059 [Datura stramonium]|uniref:Uncharacterized protein n=1 Tax=Datura stramonium TaxID=4076 RepID=A0ABS8V2S8_DATST|nr:hypothetical protein [Datura stramonium]